jgi:HSP20 family protein
METLTRSPRRTSPLRSLQEEVNRVFESVFPSSMREEDESMSAVWSPRMDLTESDENYHLLVDLPGISKKDVTISVEDNRLTIRGERRDESREESENMVRMERTFGSFYRSVRLPKSVNEDKIKATFTNGVLSVDIPKTEKSKPKRITIS